MIADKAPLPPAFLLFFLLFLFFVDLAASVSVSTCRCDVEEEKDDGSAKPPGMTWGKETTIGSWGEAGIELPLPLDIDDDACCLLFLFAFLLVDDEILL